MVSAGYRLGRDRRGVTAPVFAVGVCFVCLAVGVAIDYTRASSSRDHLQAALDVAVLAAANDGTEAFGAVGSSTFKGQFDLRFDALIQESFDRDPTGVVHGAAELDVPLAFAGFLGVDTLKVRVVAQASPRRGQSICILLVGSGSQSLLVNGGRSAKAPDCEIHVQSEAAGAVLIGGDSKLQVQRVCAASRSLVVNGRVPGLLEPDCEVAEDPFVGQLPNLSGEECQFDGGNHSDGLTPLQPGIYCGQHIFNGSTTELSSGVYVIENGTWTLNGGSLEGRNVTIHLGDRADLRLLGTVRTRLSAPNGGPTAGVLLFEKTGAPHDRFVINVDEGNRLEGLVYLPSREVIVNGGGNLRPTETTFVADSMIINTVDWSFAPGDWSIGTDGQELRPLLLTQ